jgi:hypothetical protein
MAKISMITGGSNTSGNSVATLSNLPSGMLQSLVDELGLTLSQLQAVLAGTGTLLTLDFISQATGDQVPDAAMREIVRRMVVTLEAADQQTQVLFQSVAPTDTTKIWWPTDPLTGIPESTPKTWNGSAWVGIVPAIPPAVTLPTRQNAKMLAAAGASQIQFQFNDMGTTKYDVSITPSLLESDGVTYAAPPSSITNLGWMEATRATNSYTLQVFGVPTGGLTFLFSATSQ